MIENYQEEKSLDVKEVASANFATVGEVLDDGITLIFDGETKASKKRYKCNSFIIFEPGDRVRIIKDSGTYVIEYPVGNPKKEFVVGKAELALNAEKLNGKTEMQIEAGKAGLALNAEKLNGKTEGQLEVESATNCIKADQIKNISYPGNTGITFRMTAENQLQFRMGVSYPWYRVTGQ